jgi:hypothetical protein
MGARTTLGTQQESGCQCLYLPSDVLFTFFPIKWCFCSLGTPVRLWRFDSCLSAIKSQTFGVVCIRTLMSRKLLIIFWNNTCYCVAMTIWLLSFCDKRQTDGLLATLYDFKLISWMQARATRVVGAAGGMNGWGNTSFDPWETYITMRIDDGRFINRCAIRKPSIKFRPIYASWIGIHCTNILLSLSSLTISLIKWMPPIYTKHCYFLVFYEKETDHRPPYQEMHTTLFFTSE